MSGAIVVVGSLNMDLVVRAPRHPRPGETLLGRGFGTFPGGKGANQAVAAARLGGTVRMVGRVGADGFGETMRQTLAQAGVDTTFVAADPAAPTGVALITVDDAGQNTIVVASGANAALTPDDVTAAAAAFDGAAVLLLQLESPLPVVAAAIRLARSRGVCVVLNPAPAQPLDRAILAGVDYAIPNQSELGLLTGRDSLADPAAAAAALRELGADSVIVTLGEMGVLVSTGDEVTTVPAYPVAVVDTTAAGDAFVGAFGVALAEGRGVTEAAAFGNAAGALAVTRAGAQPSLPRRAEVETLIAERMFRAPDRGAARLG